jgi:hypothetical protein
LDEKVSLEEDLSSSLEKRKTMIGVANPDVTWDRVFEVLEMSPGERDVLRENREWPFLYKGRGENHEQGMEKETT